MRLTLPKPWKVLAVLKSCPGKSTLKSANEPDLENQLLEDTLAGEDLHQEKIVTEIVIVLTEGDLIPVHPMEIEDAESTQVKEKESTKIEREIIRKARGGREIVQDLDRKSTEKEDKADPIHPESDRTFRIET